MAAPYRSRDGQRQAGRRTGIQQADRQTSKRPAGHPDKQATAQTGNPDQTAGIQMDGGDLVH